MGEYLFTLLDGWSVCLVLILMTTYTNPPGFGPREPHVLFPGKTRILFKWNVRKHKINLFFLYIKI